jgi:ribosomal protein S18 acetylase RimI-like enzyme
LASVPLWRISDKLIKRVNNTKKVGGDDAFSALRLRPATADDDAFLLNLFASTRSDELAVLNWDKNQADAFIAMQFNAKRRQYTLSFPHADDSIILWDDAPIGRMLFDRGGREFTFIDFALLPTHRGVGIGTRLIQYLFREAEAAGKPVRLHVWHSNRAKKLYQRMGFTTSDEEGMYCEMWWNRKLLKETETS